MESTPTNHAKLNIYEIGVREAQITARRQAIEFAIIPPSIASKFRIEKDLPGAKIALQKVVF